MSTSESMHTYRRRIGVEWNKIYDLDGNKYCVTYCAKTAILVEMCIKIIIVWNVTPCNLINHATPNFHGTLKMEAAPPCEFFCNDLPEIIK
jgi:hypothetical protein